MPNGLTRPITLPRSHLQNRLATRILASGMLPYAIWKNFRWFVRSAVTVGLTVFPLLNGNARRVCKQLNCLFSYWPLASPVRAGLYCCSLPSSQRCISVLQHAITLAPMWRLPSHSGLCEIDVSQKLVSSSVVGPISLLDIFDEWKAYLFFFRKQIGLLKPWKKFEKCADCTVNCVYGEPNSV